MILKYYPCVWVENSKKIFQLLKFYVTENDGLMKDVVIIITSDRSKDPTGVLKCRIIISNVKMYD